MKTTSAYRFSTLVLFLQLFFILISVHRSSAQFQDVSDLLGEPISFDNSPHGEGVSFFDFNGDGWDDLTISTANGTPLFFVNNNGNLEAAPFNIPNNSPGSISMTIWCDIDNDGDSDLLITRFGGPLDLWINDGNFNFTNTINQSGIQNGNYFHTGAAFADYNHDGCPDLYITKFYHPSFNPGPDFMGKMYEGNCDGTFSEVTEDSGVLLPPRTAFQPVFLDFNQDGWEDLFLVIDRVFWPNELFMNNGDGTFTRITDESGFGYTICSMTGSVADYDNDSDLDIYITNNPPVGNKLMRNNGNNTFEDVSEESGLQMFEACWGAVWLDYDNDTWQDIYVTLTSPVLTPIGNQFFINNQGNGFSAANEIAGITADSLESYVCARGDLNNDGYFDFVVNSRIGHNTHLYQNEGGNNNFLSVSVEGTLSNKSGIGTWIHCYAGGNHYVRYTLCGENLIAQNSSKEIFGLGDIQSVDSLVIQWNLGTTATFYNLGVNQHLHFLEGESYMQPQEIGVTGSLMLCPGDSAILDGGLYNEYIWNNGHNDRYLTIYEPGAYFVQGLNNYGVWATSDTVFIQYAPEPAVEYLTDHITCYGAQDGSILVTVNDGALENILWSTGDSLAFIQNLNAGLYTLTAIDNFGCFFNDSVLISEPDSLWANTLITNVACYGQNTGTAQPVISGGTSPYNVIWNGLDQNQLFAGTYNYSITDWNGCDAEVFFTINEPDSLEVLLSTTNSDTETGNGTATLVAQGGTPPYEVSWSNGLTDTWSISNLEPGEYFVYVTDSLLCEKISFFEIDQVSFVEENALKNTQIYPNPAQNTAKILNCEDAVIELVVQNSIGQIIFREQKFDCRNDEIPIDGMSKGIYLIRTKGNNVNATLRLIVQ